MVNFVKLPEVERAIILLIEQDQLRIRINNYNDGKYLKCEIKDNGKRIPHNTLIKIFNLFYTTKEVGALVFLLFIVP
jgi:signal transduction histidine kinase